MKSALIVESHSKRSSLSDCVPFVPYYLLGHAIELFLKSFLIGRGMSESELRNQPFGHDLRQLLAEARRRKLGNELRLSRKELNSICLLNSHYKPKHLEYYAIGLYSFPPFIEISAIVQKASDSLKGFAEKVTLAEYKRRRKKVYPRPEDNR